MQAITQHDEAIETNAILPSIRSNHVYHCIVVTYIKLVKVALSYFCSVYDLFLRLGRKLNMSDTLGDGFVLKFSEKKRKAFALS